MRYNSSKFLLRRNEGRESLGLVLIPLFQMISKISSELVDVKELRTEEEEEDEGGRAKEGWRGVDEKDEDGEIGRRWR